MLPACVWLLWQHSMLLSDVHTLSNQRHLTIISFLFSCQTLVLAYWRLNTASVSGIRSRWRFLSLYLSLRLLRQHQPCKKNLSKVLYGIVVPQTHQNESPRCRLLHFYFLTQRYWTSNQARKFKHFMFSVFDIPSACCT